MARSKVYTVSSAANGIDIYSSSARAIRALIEEAQSRAWNSPRPGREFAAFAIESSTGVEMYTTYDEDAISHPLRWLRAGYVVRTLDQFGDATGLPTAQMREVK